MAQHVKPGKGGAFMQLEMRHVTKGNKSNARLRTSEKVLVVLDTLHHSEGSR